MLQIREERLESIKTDMTSRQMIARAHISRSRLSMLSSVALK